MKRTPRPPQFDWSRIVAKRLKVLTLHRHFGRKIGGRGIRLKPLTMVAGGMVGYFEARRRYKLRDSKHPRARYHMRHGTPINRPLSNKR